LPKDAGIAAIIVEPVFSAGGLFLPPPGYLKKLSEFAHEIGALLIVDEAQTGFGRTGKWFASELHDIEPDILVVSKSSGAGFPVSAVITTDKIADQVAARGWLHLSSHQSDPLPAAALAATIDIVREEHLVDQAASYGRYLMDLLQPMKAKHPCIVDVRGVGLMIGIEIGDVADQSGKELCALVVALCEARGVHLTYTYFEPVIRIIPALTITRQEMDKAVSVLDESFGIALKGGVTMDSLMPSNRYSRAFVDRMRNKKTLRGIATRLFETSPKYWIKKLREGSDR
jgi:2,2-dialkylglycine decarboxylase (pyruvate)